MLSNFVGSYFNQSTTKTLSRFEQSVDLKQIAEQIKLLDAQEKELDKGAKKYGAGSIDFKKYIVVNDLLQHIRFAIKQFNHVSFEQNNRITEVTHLLVLLRKMATHVQAVIDQDRYTLNTQRNNNKFYANLGINAATATAVLMTAGISVVGIGGGVVAASLTKAAVGSNEDDTTTYKLVWSLRGKINEACKNLEDYYNRNYETVAINCVIDQLKWGAIALSVHPVFCYLPTEMKVKILNYIPHEHITSTVLPTTQTFGYQLFETIKTILRERERKNNNALENETATSVQTLLPSP